MKMKILICVMVGFLITVLGDKKTAEPKTSTGSCEPIELPLCKDLPYNHTIMPNILGHQNQHDAGVELNTFAILADIECSPALWPFLCSVYAPECESGSVRAKPCKRSCEVARKGCEKALRLFRSAWPEQLNCDHFIEENFDESCFLNPAYISIKRSELPSVLNAKSAAEKVLSPETCRILFVYSDKDLSGDLNTDEYQSLKDYLSVLSPQLTELWLPGPYEYSTFAKMLDLRGENLSTWTTQVLWKTYNIGKETKYDEFVAILTRLAIMQERFQAKIVSGLPCNCVIAGFTYDEYIRNSIV